MKNFLLILILLLAFLLNACGGGSAATGPTCSSQPSLGLWVENDETELNLYGDCTGTDLACDAEFIWTPAVNNRSTVTILSTNGGPSCPAIGEHSCYVSYSMDFSGELLSLKCGSYPWRNYGR